MASAHKCMIVRTSDGARTSVSIPPADVARFIETCYGSQQLFRRHLNAAAFEIAVRPESSRSQLVRVYLERCMTLIDEIRS